MDNRAEILEVTSQSDQINQLVLKEIDEEYQKSGSYFDLVPKEYQKHVTLIAQQNFSKYQEDFKNDDREFLEQMSKNWLAKFRAFGMLALRAGFQEVNSQNPEFDASHLQVAVLTRSSSYVLIDLGVIGSRGGRVHYERMPLREAEKGPDIDRPSNAVVMKAPVKGERLMMIPDKSRPTEHVKTSEIIAVYGRLPDVSISSRKNLDEMSGLIKQSFISIDQQTLH